MRTKLGFFLFLIFHGAQAQEITVLDKDSNEPLHNVVIYTPDKSKSTYTDFDGNADLSEFSSQDEIIFYHISHKSEVFTKSRILRENNIVHLQSDENELGEVVLSVAKFELNKRDVPQQIISLSSKDVQFSNPQTSADLLQSSGQVFVQKSQLGGGSPIIRGFSTNRLLITVDGVRMNNAIFRSGNIQNIISIDPLSIDKTEVILGPGSVIYGSDAVGGVMNFYTLKPTFSSEKKTSFSGNAYTRYASANHEKTVHTNFNIGSQKWAFHTSITYSDFEDLKMGSDGPGDYLRPQYAVTRNGQDLIVQNGDPLVQKPTGYNQINLLEKIRYMPDGIWDFSLGLNYSSTSDFPRYDRLTQKRNGQLRSAEWYYGPQTWFMGNFKIDKNGKGPLYDNAQFIAAYQYFEESRNNRDFREEVLFNSEENVGAYSTNFDFEKKFEESKLFYGAEYVFNEVHSHGQRINILTQEMAPDASRYPDDSNWQSLAAYASYHWNLKQNLSLQTGARYNHVLVHADFNNKFFDFPFQEANIGTGALTGSAGLSWKQNEIIRWKFNLSTAFRAPNIDDVGKIFDSEPGSVVVPNPGLKSEYAYNGEIGLNLDLAENIRFDFAGFYTYLDNALVRRDFNLNGETQMEYQGQMSRIQAIQNASRAYVYGFEGGLEVDLSVALRLTSQISITEGKEEKEDGTKAALRHAAPIFGNIHFTCIRKK